jgi:DNA-binding MarR family transcriptional regulator
MDQLMRMAQSVAIFRSIHLKSSLNILSDSSDYRVLIMVFHYDGGNGIRPNQIADYFHCTRPYISKIVKSLIRKGFLLQMPDETDGRSYYLQCSSAGGEIVKVIMDDYLKITKKLYDGLGAKKSAKLIALLEESTTILEG